MKTRLLLPAVLLCLVGAAACSDDGDSPSGGESISGGTASEQPTAASPVPTDGPVFGDNCDVTGTVSGALTAGIKAVGGSSTDVGKGGPAAFYQIVTSKGLAITIYAAGKGFKESVLLSSGADSYTQPGGPQGIEAAADGSSASVDGELESATGGATVRLQVDFTCSAPTAPQS